ncbi:MAG: hypothetical protein AAFY81_11550, partial [Pseudomonadota bacterium]
PIMAIALLAIVVGGFVGVQISPNGFETRPITAIVALHGLTQIAWFALLIAQPYFVRTRQMKLHMTLGTLSVALAALVVITGYFVTRGAYADPDWTIAQWSHSASTMLPFCDIVTFALAYALGYRFRRSPAAHKRLMLLAGLFMIDPAMARLVTATDAFPPLILIAELALFASMLVYDWRTLGRPHWASVMGLALFAAVTPLKMVVAEMPIWADTIGPALFG